MIRSKFSNSTLVITKKKYIYIYISQKRRRWFFFFRLPVVWKKVRTRFSKWVSQSWQKPWDKSSKSWWWSKVLSKLMQPLMLSDLGRSFLGWFSLAIAKGEREREREREREVQERKLNLSLAELWHLRRRTWETKE